MPTRMTTLLDRPTMGTPPRSARRSAADEMVTRFARAAGVELQATPVRLAAGTHVVVDGASSDGTVFVETQSTPWPLTHVDLAQAAQAVFTLALVRSDRPHARAVLLVPDDDCLAAVTARVAGTPGAGLVEILVCP